jgi:hypothetical protein
MSIILVFFFEFGGYLLDNREHKLGKNSTVIMVERRRNEKYNF